MKFKKVCTYVLCVCFLFTSCAKDSYVSNPDAELKTESSWVLTLNQYLA